MRGAVYHPIPLRGIFASQTAGLPKLTFCAGVKRTADVGMTNEQRVAHEAEKERRRKDYKLRDLRYKSPAEGERKSPRKSRV